MQAPSLQGVPPRPPQAIRSREGGEPQEAGRHPQGPRREPDHRPRLGPKRQEVRSQTTRQVRRSGPRPQEAQAASPQELLPVREALRRARQGVRGLLSHPLYRLPSGSVSHAHHGPLEINDANP